jgi:hypothetical protein
MLLISVIDPKIFDVCVQATNLVFSVSSFSRSDAVSVGFVFESDGFHQTTFRLRHLAIWTQDAMLASWSHSDIMSSEPGGYFRAIERLRKSCVVEGPITMHFGSALTYLAAESTPSL